MGDTDNVLGAANARALIIDFFTIIENRQKLFDEIVEILKKNDDFFYIYKNIEKFETFQDCIINGHFQWILDVTDKQDETELDSEYTNECIVANKIYIDFYKIFNDSILKSNEFSERAKRLLLKYSEFLIE